MGTGWLTCIPAVLLPHSPCRFTTANAPANRQMPIASVVMGSYRKKKKLPKIDLQTIKFKNYDEKLCDFPVRFLISINPFSRMDKEAANYNFRQLNRSENY